MAEEHQQSKAIATVTQEIAHSRDRLARDLAGLRYELDFPLKFRKSFQRHWKQWISATAAFGALISLIPARTKKIYIGDKKSFTPPRKILEAGFVIGALKLAASLLRPIVISFITKKLSGSSRGSKRNRDW